MGIPRVLDVDNEREKSRSAICDVRRDELDASRIYVHTRRSICTRRSTYTPGRTKYLGRCSLLSYGRGRTIARGRGVLLRNNN